MRYAIRHQTFYRYDFPVAHSIQELRLTPESGPMQRVEQWHLQAPGNLFASRDGFGNRVHHFTLAKPSASMLVQAEGVVETLPPVETFTETSSPAVPIVSPHYFISTTPLTHAHDGLAAFAAPFIAGGRPRIERLLALTEAIADRVRYQSEATDVHTSAGEAFAIGAGVCQDQAHVLIACCRAHGIPARYVSGYFHAPDAANLASHAWADICIDPDAARWASFDVTHRCISDARHVRLAVGRDYLSAAPVRGVRRGGGREQMRVEIDIRTLG